MSSPFKSQLKRSKYRILGLIGQGQFGKVYCAVHRQTGQLVALKSLDHQRFPTHKFLRELRFLLSLQHKNIVTCQALEHTHTGRYLVMDYCEGGTLRNLMESGDELRPSQYLKIIADILAGLDHAHSRGIVHCDIKPENILLSLEPTGWVARITDFGIARLSQELAGEDLSNTGSPAYMAPERFYGQYSVTSDLYSVGILLYELVAGYRPFSGTPINLMSAHLNRPIRIPEQLPEVWQTVLLKSLQKLSARRFQSAAEMLTGLERAIASGEKLQLISTAQPSETEAGSASWPNRLSSSSDSASLLRSFTYQHHRCLEQAVVDVAIAPTAVGLPIYSAADRQIMVHHYQSATQEPLRPELLADMRVKLPASIRSIVLQSQTLFALTNRAIYALAVNAESARPASPQMIAQLSQDYVATFDPRGRWLATAIALPEPLLFFWPLHASGLSVHLPPHPLPLRLPSATPYLLNLIALDASHLAVVTVSISPAQNSSGAQHGPSTTLELFTRRGSCLGKLSLPTQIGQIITTSIPYRLLATDTCNPDAVLLIDLKPYRLSRLRVGIVPTQLVATAWGYVLMDAEGQIVLLDQEGQRINQIMGPAHPTAIASFNKHSLIITTWSGNSGSLYVTDLRDSNVDILF